MEALKKCSTDTCPMQASACKYVLDFNPKYDKARTTWERERREAAAGPQEGRLERVMAVDRVHKPLVEPILMADIRSGIVRCKADAGAPLNENLSLDQIAETFGITRPRVQQIEARAKEKLLSERKEFADYLSAVKPQG